MSIAQAVAQEVGEGAQLQANRLILLRFQHIAQPSFAFSVPVLMGEVIRALGISLQAWGLWGVFSNLIHCRRVYNSMSMQTWVPFYTQGISHEP